VSDEEWKKRVERAVEVSTYWFEKFHAANERIRLLIAERDTARRQADQHYKLREEFRELLGTDDVERGVAVVREMKERIKQLEDVGDKMEIYCDTILARDWKEAKEAKP